MQRMQYILLGVTVGVMIIGTTIVHGYRTERFSDHNTNEVLQVMAKRLDNMPKLFGDWVGTELSESEDQARIYRDVARVTGWKNFVYRHNLSGRQMQISIVCGHNRHVGIHTPDQCMIGQGWEFAPGEHDRADETDAPGAGKVYMRTAQFVKTGSSETQRISWTFTCDGDWIAPDMGRAGLVEKPGWYKLYVTVAAVGTQTIGTDETKDFLKTFIPRLNEALFPTTPEAPAAATPAAAPAAS